MKKLTFLHTAFCLTTMAVAALSATSCADDIDINNNNGGKGNALTLKLNTANYHKDADARITRVINAQAPNGQNIKVVETDYNFIEDNITPVAALTRGTMFDNIDAMPQDTKFGIYGYSSATSFEAIGNTANFINNGMAGKDGKVTINNQAKNWDITQKYMKIAGTYPSTVALTKSGNDYSFSYSPATKCDDQQDVMVGMTQAHITDLSTAPNTNLTMHHALTAVNVAIGSNLNFDNVKVVGISFTGTLSTVNCKATFNNDAATFNWENGSGNATHHLKFSEPIALTKTTQNVQITGVQKNGKRDNYTFLMLPMTKGQGKNLKLHLYLLSNNKTQDLTVDLSKDFNGWQAGHTVTYTVTNKSTAYTFAVEETKPVQFDNNKATFKIKSFKSLKNGSKNSTPVKWKIKNYEVNNSGSTQTEAPKWFSVLNPGEGSINSKEFTVEFKPNEETNVNKLDELNNSLKTVSATTTLLGGKDVNELTTANCYIISNAGTYKLPLVYGNALKNGLANSMAYCDAEKKPYFQTHVETATVDKNNKQTGHSYTRTYITKPWIKDNGSEEEFKATGYKVIWDDIDLQSHATIKDGKIIEENGHQFLQFTVDKEKIKNGNVDVAVTNKKGTIIWSWHLWFTKPLTDDVQLTNNTTLASLNLGWKYSLWTENKEETVKVTFEQEESKETTSVTFVRPKAEHVQGTSPCYQMFRKDPFPMSKSTCITNLSKNQYTTYDAGGVGFSSYDQVCVKNQTFKEPTVKTFADAIKTPCYFFIGASPIRQNDQSDGKNYCWVIGEKADYPYWRTANGNKTVYDPCPAGYQMPTFDVFKELKDDKKYTETFTETEDHKNIEYFTFTSKDNSKKVILHNCGTILGAKKSGKALATFDYTQYNSATIPTSNGYNGLLNNGYIKGVLGLRLGLLGSKKQKQSRLSSEQFTEATTMDQAKNATTVRPMYERKVKNVCMHHVG